MADKRIYADRDFSFSVSRMNNMFDQSVGVQRVYWSKNFKRGAPFSDGSDYSNPLVDEALEKASVETDPAVRKDLFMLRSLF
jgi:peptide/nickel transport system substrate-binding protein